MSGRASEPSASRTPVRTTPAALRKTPGSAAAISGPEAVLAGSAPDDLFLLRAGYADSTLRKYLSAVGHFLSWCSASRIAPDDEQQLDLALARYFHDLYITNLGRGKQKARDALYGIEMLLPRLKGKLLIAARTAHRWAKSQPPESYPPLTWELTVAIAVQMVRVGAYRFGVATVLAFATLLRISELTSIRREDVRLPGDPRLGLDHAATVLRFPRAKGGRNQSVEVKNPEVVSLLQQVIARTKPGALIFPGGAPAYRSVFKSVCAELGLSPLYVPHSLRHGGATRLKLQKNSLEDIMEHGRWASSRSARTYINAGRAKAIAAEVPVALARTAAALASDLLVSFALAQTH